MAFFDRLKDNPIVGIIIVCSAIVPATVAVVTYFNKNIQKLFMLYMIGTNCLMEENHEDSEISSHGNIISILHLLSTNRC